MCNPLASDRAQFENIAPTQPLNGKDKKLVRKREVSKVKWLQSSKARTWGQNVLSKRLCSPVRIYG